jgi:hypothetical protein
MTKDEAKTKWCPMARTVDDAVKTVSVNRLPNWGGTPDPDCVCIASACMMWRWDKTCGSWHDQNFEIVQSLTDGYCGLAGNPCR